MYRYFQEKDIESHTHFRCLHRFDICPDDRDRQRIDQAYGTPAHETNPARLPF